MVRHALDQPQVLRQLLLHFNQLVVIHGRDPSHAVPAKSMGLGYGMASP